MTPRHVGTISGTVTPWGGSGCAWWHHGASDQAVLGGTVSPHIVPSLLSPWHLKDQAMPGGTVSPQMCHPCCPHVTLVALCHLTLSHFCCPHVTLRTRPCLVALCHPRLCHICCPQGTLVALLSPQIVPHLLFPCHPEHQATFGGTVSPHIVSRLLSPWHPAGTVSPHIVPSPLSPCHPEDQALFGGTVVTSHSPIPAVPMAP